MLSWRRVEGPVAVGNATRSWDARAGLLVSMAEEGRVGQGEASPLPGFSRETLGECEAVLFALAGAPHPGPPPAARGEGVPEYAEPRSPGVPGYAEPRSPGVPEYAEPRSPGVPGYAEPRSPGGPEYAEPRSPPPPPARRGEGQGGGFVEVPPALRFALETARLDLVAQKLGLPLARVIEPRLPRTSAPLCKLVATEAEAQAAVEAGFRCLKLKIGRDFAAELALVATLRRRFDVALRLDGNGALDADKLAALAPHNPELVEEPVPATRLRALGRPPVRVALDESLATLPIEEIAGLLHDGLADVLVLKPMLLGGAQRCLELARLAKERGARVTVSHLFDGPVALAAACALALAIPGDLLPCGLAPHAGLGAWPAATFTTFADADIVLPDEAGLGVAWS